jgi:hypothetical protein
MKLPPHRGQASRKSRALVLLSLLALIPAESLAQANRNTPTSPSAEGTVYFPENRPLLAALEQDIDAPDPLSAAREGDGARPSRTPLRARGSGQRSGDSAWSQLLRGFATLEGELARVPQAGGRYRVQPGDTLDDIIFRTLGDLSVRHEVVRDAFIRANPRAFRRKNPNYLFAGVELRIPGAQDFRAVVFDDPKVGQTIDRRRMIRYP